MPRNWVIKILMLDDRAPHSHLGAGYPRAHDILAALCDMGHKVSFVPCTHTETRKEANKSLPERCKYLPLKSPTEIAEPNSRDIQKLTSTNQPRR